MVFYLFLTCLSLSGGPNAVHLLKAEASARERICSLALTDGTALGCTGSMSISI